jgi:hypothetical protein
MNQRSTPCASTSEQHPNPHLAWVVEWGAIDLPLGHPSRITCLSIYHDEHDAACALYDAGKEFNARMWPVSLQWKGQPALAATESE